MTTLHSDIEDLLREYINDGKVDRANRKDQIESIKEAIHRISNQLMVLEAKYEQSIARVNERIEGLNARIIMLERDQDDTGKFNVAQIEKDLEHARQDLVDQKKKADALTWKVLGGIGALIMVILSAIASVVVSILTKKGQP